MACMLCLRHVNKVPACESRKPVSLHRFVFSGRPRSTLLALQRSVCVTSGFWLVGICLLEATPASIVPGLARAGRADLDSAGGHSRYCCAHMARLAAHLDSEHWLLGCSAVAAAGRIVLRAAAATVGLPAEPEMLAQSIGQPDRGL